MRTSRFILPIFFILVGIVFLVATLNLPKARLGDPYGPLYFPGIISAFLIFIAIVYLIGEWKDEYQHSEAEIKQLLRKRTLYLISFTLLFSLIYALIFERIGFLISTILFLGALLFLINGPKKWKINITVAVLFSLIAWYGFSQLLGISLP